MACGKIFTYIYYIGVFFHLLFLFFQITATSDGSQISLVVDDFDVYTLDTPDSALTIPAAPIYFGGVPEKFPLAPGATTTQSSFVGCIGDTTINGKLINYASSTQNQGASVSKCPLPEEPVGGPTTPKPIKGKRIDDDTSETVPFEPVIEPESPVQIDVTPEQGGKIILEPYPLQ